MDRAVAKRRWVARLVLLAVAALVFASCWMVRPPVLPGTLGAVASRVRVGMGQSEAVALIRSCGTDGLDTVYFRGVTRDGLPFSGSCGFDGLPPADQVAHGELEVDDEYGRELLISLDPGGVVSGVRLSSPDVMERWRFAIWR